ncbi:hypothetical protein PDIG_43990 [Penicillium digitatum PHI26]|uniref:Uncharacterized protein n=2 Tax=Penicillium digitatum TaxID=36651 RepID=K9FS29_PEND2|nr:hypothetical protein PDIP_35220 [Penicillium digitatum Pd1]EKV12475.1 hypothetical protein PDIG_43990 [Penicillium digitatum PHI26]EKV16539.1 hypothetical protein PDIP_35220 [Penicillium digitatum Pd1]
MPCNTSTVSTISRYTRTCRENRLIHLFSRRPSIVRGLANSRSPFSALPTTTSSKAVEPIRYHQRPPRPVTRLTSVAQRKTWCRVRRSAEKSTSSNGA